jgi:hypothetical protein
VAARLFTPMFTIRAEDMSLGLSLCCSVIEQHGSAHDFVEKLVADPLGINVRTVEVHRGRVRENESALGDGLRPPRTYPIRRTFATDGWPH